MLDKDTKKRIDDCRDILVGKLPDPKSQIEQITIALIYKFMDDMDRETIELGGEARFFSGEFAPYGWSKLFDPQNTSTDLVRLYGDAIEKMEKNPNVPQLFRDIFKNAYLPYRDPETLRLFLKTIGAFEYSHSEKLGDAFEYLLSVMGSQGDAGQFRTPRHIIDFMVALMDPTKDDVIIDPACGTAGFLISAYKHILKENSGNYKKGKDQYAFELHGVKQEELTADQGKRYSGDKLTPDERKRIINNIKGYDISPDMVRMSLVNLYLHGFSDPHIFEYDSLSSEERWGEEGTLFLANPPFMTPKGGIRPHKRFSVQSNRAEVLFVDYMAEHLTKFGRAAIIVPEGVIFQSGTAYKSLRKLLVESNYLVGVISLPAGVFQPYSGVKTSILWLDKKLAAKTDDILFVKVQNDGFDLGAQRRPIKGNDLPEIYQKLVDYKTALADGETPNLENDPQLWTASKKDIAENGDYNLSGERYKHVDNRNWLFSYVKLQDICDLQNGFAFKSSDYVEYSNTLNIRMSSIRPVTGFSLDHNPRYLPDSYTEKYSEFLLSEGDVIIAMTDMANDPKILGVPTIVSKSSKAMLLNQRVGRFKNIDESRLRSSYLKHILNTNSVREYYKTLGGGGLQVNISKKDVLGIEIPLPPLPVQEEIVAEVEGYQKIIDGARMVVDNYQPRIDIDHDWPMVELGEVCEIKRGKFAHRPRNAPHLYGGDYPFLQTGDVVRANGGVVDYTQTLNEEGLATSKLFEPTIVLITIAANIGDTAILNFKSCFTDSVVGLIPKKETELSPYFLNFMMMRQKEYLNRVAPQAAQKNINVEILKVVTIPVPPIEIQIEHVQRIEKEQQLIDSTKKLIALYEGKIRERIGKVWGEEAEGKKGADSKSTENSTGSDSKSPRSSTESETSSDFPAGKNYSGEEERVRMVAENDESGYGK